MGRYTYGVWQVIGTYGIFTIVEVMKGSQTPHIKNGADSRSLTIELFPLLNFLPGLHHRHVLCHKSSSPQSSSLISL